MGYCQRARVCIAIAFYRVNTSLRIVQPFAPQRFSIEENFSVTECRNRHLVHSRVQTTDSFSRLCTGVFAVARLAMSTTSHINSNIVWEC
mmetsp:Transcript_107450/g.284740  ORF Transcript_107450/g.284740 Transcript_107450/m.284740 type:complete len:90 (-) Transcript_107450:8-277(-)